MEKGLLNQKINIPDNIGEESEFMWDVAGKDVEVAAQCARVDGDDICPFCSQKVVIANKLKDLKVETSKKGFATLFRE